MARFLCVNSIVLSYVFLICLFIARVMVVMMPFFSLCYGDFGEIDANPVFFLFNIIGTAQVKNNISSILGVLGCTRITVYIFAAHHVMLL